ncbi:hypothetical protein BSZ39_06090 [Bowdeniella nasicola]|uniref:DUF998 domain-containing protein n=1 Tax=Bowdeniella nasicola TaxID=208480 RepID=A0A1Q5Q340_9ACTO|nr:DUF998 domain-containing protein [Bowdeniella nasicola]OKL54082.1 hypothetical protein BSZ39_06090 [Bowdeniella nasicola]
MDRYGRIALAIAAIAYSTWLLGPWLVPQMPLVSSYASELAADGVPYADVFRWGDRITGVVLLFAATRASGWFRIPIAIWGGATLLDSFSPMTCSPSIASACVLKNETFPTIQDTLHVVASSTATVASLGAVLAVWYFGPRMTTPWRLVAWAVVIATGVLIVSSILTELGVAHQGLGYFQRSQLATLSLWTLFAALWWPRDFLTSPVSDAPPATPSR